MSSSATIVARLVHLSDLHFGLKDPQSVWDLLLKHVTSMAPAPTGIVVTGDIVNTPKEAHFKKAVSALRSFGAIPVFVCPGNHESAGKRYRGKTCKGNRYLRRGLVQCAWGARKTPTFLGRTFRRLEVRIGKKKAALAIAHKILVIVYHLLATGSGYEEARYDHGHPKQEARERQRAIKALERLGYTVIVERAA